MSDSIQFQELRETNAESSDSSGSARRPEDLSELDRSAQVDRGEGTPLRERVARERAAGLRSILIGFSILSGGVTIALIIQLIAGEPQITDHGGVTSCSKICSQMGIDILKKGGNAVDAAITTELCVGVVHPQFAGIGGGGLMLIHNHKTHKSTLLDFREEAPEKISARPDSDQDIYRRTGQGVGVPSETKGLWEAHERLGRLEWKKLLEPVIELAKTGFPRTAELDEDLVRREEDLDWQLNNARPLYERFKEIFDNQDEDMIKRPDLARVLEDIAEQGPDAIYKGKYAEEIVNSVQKWGGAMSLDDLENYQVKERRPINASIAGHQVVTFGAPSSGSVMLRMLNDMNKSETFKTSELGSAVYYTELAKILNTAYPCRNKLGDPDETGVKEEEKKILNPQLDSSVVCGPQPTDESKGTSHVNVIDTDELMVSLTTSMNWWFGSLIVTKSGILLNNQLDDFSNDISSVNAASGGKRPLTSMVPTVVYDEKRPCKSRMVIGGVNGSKIFSGVAQTIGNFLFFHQGLKTAIDVPRLWCNDGACILQGNNLGANVGKEISEGAKVSVEMVDWYLSVVGAVKKTNNTLSALTDDYDSWTGIIY